MGNESPDETQASGVSFVCNGAADWTRDDFDRMMDFAQSLPGDTVMTVTGPAGQKWEFRKLPNRPLVAMVSNAIRGGGE